MRFCKDDGVTRERRYYLIGTLVAIVLSSAYVLRSDISVGGKLSLLAVGSAVVVAMALLRSSDW